MILVQITLSFPTFIRSKRGQSKQYWNGVVYLYLCHVDWWVRNISFEDVSTCRHQNADSRIHSHDSPTFWLITEFRDLCQFDHFLLKLWSHRDAWTHTKLIPKGRRYQCLTDFFERAEPPPPAICGEVTLWQVQVTSFGAEPPPSVICARVALWQVQAQEHRSPRTHTTVQKNKDIRCKYSHVAHKRIAQSCRPGTRAHQCTSFYTLYHMLSKPAFHYYNAFYHCTTLFI